MIAMFALFYYIKNHRNHKCFSWKICGGFLTVPQGNDLSIAKHSYRPWSDW